MNELYGILVVSGVVLFVATRARWVIPLLGVGVLAWFLLTAGPAASQAGVLLPWLAFGALTVGMCVAAVIAPRFVNAAIDAGDELAETEHEATATDGVELHYVAEVEPAQEGPTRPSTWERAYRRAGGTSDGLREFVRNGAKPAKNHYPRLENVSK